MSITKRYVPEIGSKTCRNCGNVRADHTLTGTTLACPVPMQEIIQADVPMAPHPVDVAHSQLLRFVDLCATTGTPITRAQLMRIPNITVGMVDAVISGMRLTYTGEEDSSGSLYFQVEYSVQL